MKILQVCNVGEICGGTAACAWTITHALPEIQHAVWFLSSLNVRTRESFRHCQVEQHSWVNDQLVAECDPDLVILHNTNADRVPTLESAVTVQYHHSAGHRTRADLHVACSQWLLDRTSQPDRVLYQPVSIPRRNGLIGDRILDDELRVGRLCTPTSRKWPTELVSFYKSVAPAFSQVIWEFVGVPPELKRSIAAACQNRCRFHDAGVSARSHLWNWHAVLYHHPTLTESFGRVVAEAMRVGCVPIVDAKGGFIEQIDHDATGFLCSTQTDFDAALHRLEDRSVWSRISREAKFVADQRSSLESFRITLREQLRMFSE